MKSNSGHLGCLGGFCLKAASHAGFAKRLPGTVARYLSFADSVDFTGFWMIYDLVLKRVKASGDEPKS